MGTGGRCLRALIASCLSLGVASCDYLNPSPQRQRPLPATAQAVAAEKLAAAFAGACLSEADPTAATQRLRAAGWPRFNTVWRDPSGAFYAAPPSPAGLFVIGDHPRGKVADTRRLTCVGHYPAETAAPMVAAIGRRWGAARLGAGPYPGALVWTFRVRAGAITPVVATGGLSPDDAAILAPDEAHAYVQVFYNPALGDVASLIAVSRPTR
jgi:hypothetical protein